MGWTGACPTLSRKKPTASLVSRKVLTPLLGQVLICILIQVAGLEAVQRQIWYAQYLVKCRMKWPTIDRFIPPKLDTEHSNIQNSENSTLFLLSCFQYILSAIILSVGYPFRQSLNNNREPWPKLTLMSPQLTCCSALCCYYRRGSSFLMLYVARPSKTACRLHAADPHEHHLQGFLDNTCVRRLCLRMGLGAPSSTMGRSSDRESVR